MKTERPSDTPLPSRSARIGDLSVEEVRRATITAVLFLVVLCVFLYMVHEMLVAGILGVIIGAYLRPVYVWLVNRLGNRGVSAGLTLLLLLSPPIGLIIYGYVEIRKTAVYVAENKSEVAGEITAGLARIPLMENVEELISVATIEKGLADLADLALQVPVGFQQFVAEFAVDTWIFLFSAFYVLVQANTLVAYLRGKVPARYGPLAEKLEQHVQGALYGAVYGTLITQICKAVLILVLNLAFGVPLAVVIALLTFVIGFFPIVGSWTIYVPVAGYLLIFADSPWKAAGMLVGGFVFNTVLLSLLIRPKLAAEKSRILNFYWMFVALVAGVYTFGIPGIVLGPVVVALLKAIFDTSTTELDWLKAEGKGPEAEVFAEGKAGTGAPPTDEP